jgi:hypothetical protein
MSELGPTITKLEPTITEHEPTATERLRALLDERGVEYELTAWSCGAAVWWRDSSGTMWRAHDNDEDELLSFYAYNSVTPEQAIAATLGSCNCSNSERTETCKSDETDTIKCWVKCKDEPSSERMELIHIMECSVCGGTYEHVNGGYEFCPRCGRKVVDA